MVFGWRDIVASASAVLEKLGITDVNAGACGAAGW